MRAHITVSTGLVILALITAGTGQYAAHWENTYAQTHPRFRQVLLSLQFLDFMMCGGGPLAPQQNYWAWQFTNGLHEAPAWKRLVMGEWLMYQPFGYWVPPPKVWPYPPKF